MWSRDALRQTIQCIYVDSGCFGAVHFSFGAGAALRLARDFAAPLADSSFGGRPRDGTGWGSTGNSSAGGAGSFEGVGWFLVQNCL